MLCTKAGLGVTATNYHLGLDFIESSVPSIPYLDDNYGFDPFPLIRETDPTNYFRVDGGLVGWTEAEAQRAAAIAVDDAYRAVDTGSADKTLRVQVHVGAVPVSTPGRRINMIVGASQDPNRNYLGLSISGAAFDETGYPNDTYTAVAYVDELEQLRDYDSDLRFTTSDSVFNNVGGTIAHEFAHNFGLSHVARGSSQPYAMMATASTGLEVIDRLSMRRFDDTPDTQQGEHSSESMLVHNIGVVYRADFDMSDEVNSNDASIITANWLLTDRLFQEGDANADHIVDSDDASAINANWLVEADVPVAGTATASYDAATGEVWISGAHVSQVGIRSDSNGLGAGAVNWLNTFTLQEPSRTERVIETMLGSNIAGPAFSGSWDDHLYFTAPADIAEGDFDFQVRYQAVGGDVTFADVVYIPEPGTMLLLLAGACSLLVWRRRRGLRR